MSVRFSASSTWRRPLGLRFAGLKPCATFVLMACLLALAAFGVLSAQTRQPSVVAIKGGTILTVTKGTIQNGTVVLRDGKIAAVGANVQVPAGATVVDATGKFV